MTELMKDAYWFYFKKDSDALCRTVVVHGNGLHGRIVQRLWIDYIKGDTYIQQYMDNYRG